LLLPNNLNLNSCVFQQLISSLKYGLIFRFTQKNIVLIALRFTQNHKNDKESFSFFELLTTYPVIRNIEKNLVFFLQHKPQYPIEENLETDDHSQQR